MDAVKELTVIRRPRRRTHLTLARYNRFGIVTLCNIMVPVRDIDAVSTDLSGGATERLLNFLRGQFNDDTCCKRCTASSALIVAIYRSRDTGLRSA